MVVLIHAFMHYRIHAFPYSLLPVFQYLITRYSDTPRIINNISSMVCSIGLFNNLFHYPHFMGVPLGVDIKNTKLVDIIDAHFA